MPRLHPAEVLVQCFNADKRFPPSSFNGTTVTEDSRVDDATVQACVNVLRLHEANTGVAFVTVDTAKLAAVHAAYTEVLLGGAHSDLTTAVADLLGLES